MNVLMSEYPKVVNNARALSPSLSSVVRSALSYDDPSSIAKPGGENPGNWGTTVSDRGIVGGVRGSGTSGGLILLAARSSSNVESIWRAVSRRGVGTAAGVPVNVEAAELWTLMMVLKLKSVLMLRLLNKTPCIEENCLV